MAKRLLKRVRLPQEVVDKLTRNGVLTCQDLLYLHHLELLKILQISDEVIQGLLLKTCRACLPKLTTAYEIQSQKHHKYLATSLKKLDLILRGGVPCGSVTEITGPSGCGKTQFCVMLTVQATLPYDLGGLSGSVVYIDTESAFCPQRLLEVAKCRYPAVYHSDESLRQLAERVLVFSATTCDGLKEMLNKLEVEIISKGIKLVIIDSIASLVRKEFDMDGAAGRIERANLLTSQASYLKYAAEAFHIPVVVTNQVTTRFGTSLNSPPSDDDRLDTGLNGTAAESGYVTAALGNTWSHCVNTRLIVQYLDSTRRQLLIAKSPVAPYASFTYTITSQGITLKDAVGSVYKGTDPGLQKIRTRKGLCAQLSEMGPP